MRIFDSSITLMIGIPLLGALLQLLWPRTDSNSPRWGALISSLIASVCALSVVAGLYSVSELSSIREHLAWVGSYSIFYDVSIDGFNAVVVSLVAIVSPLLIILEWAREKDRRGIHGLLLLIQSSLFGVSCSENLFLSFLFWGFLTIPFYFLIAIWGDQQREAAAFRYIVSSSIGNALLIACLILVYFAIEPHSFAISDFLGGKLQGAQLKILDWELSLPSVTFLLFSLGIATRVAIWPGHGWLSSVVKEAPVSAIVALTGLFFPVAVHFYAKISYTLFPAEVIQYRDLIMGLGCINILFGALGSLSHRDLRSMVPFVWFIQTGILLIGFGSLEGSGVVGAIFQELSVGLGMAGFGLLLGVLETRRGNCNFIDESGEAAFGGVVRVAPKLAIVSTLTFITLLGFPGIVGFWGQSLVMMGSYVVNSGVVVVVLMGIVLLTFSLFNVFRCVFLGSSESKTINFGDLSRIEQGCTYPIVVTVVILGMLPKPLLDIVRPSVLNFLETIR